MHNNSSGIIDIFVHQSSAVCPIEFGHIKLFSVSVQPVDLPAHPVDGQPFQPMSVVANDRLLLAAIQEHSLNDLVADVAEIQSFLPVIETKGNDIAQAHLY